MEREPGESLKEFHRRQKAEKAIVKESQRNDYGRGKNRHQPARACDEMPDADYYGG